MYFGYKDSFNLKTDKKTSN